jgi:hypothetical protein
MKLVARAVAALSVCLLSAGAYAGTPVFGSTEAERLSAAMKSARWTGPMLASNAETLPQGHFYTEPYFYDVIVGGDHHPGSSGFYQYGLRNSLTVGVQPSFATGTNSLSHGATIGDFKLLSQVRLTHFTAEHRVPTIAIVLNEVLPTGKADRLRPGQEGHGSGSFATEVGINVQQYVLLKNGHLLRARINLLQSIPYGTHVTGRSVYGTDVGFSGHARPGAKTTLIGAVEYSLTREWVLALDVIRESTRMTRLHGIDANGAPVERNFPATRDVGFAPAVEYNWSDRAGILLGVWITPKGHNSPSSVIPAIAIQRFW